MQRHLKNSVGLIGVASGLGAQDHGCEDGPLLLGELKIFQGNDIPAQWEDILRPAANLKSPTAAIAELCSRLASRVADELASGRFPLVIGGDHSCAIGTWSGVHQWLGARGPLGLIWIDAHMDSHTFATTPSGALHGMPLACLLGHGEPALTSIATTEPKLSPEHVCLLGVRSYEAGEAALLNKLGVRVITMNEIRQRGMTAALAEAMAIARNGTAGYGVSIDLDVLDPAEEPGVGSPAPGGLSCDELEQALHLLHGDPAMLAMEIVEYNPHRDRDHLTAKAAGALFRSAL
ncbi:MAG: arginase [Nitrosomonadales bacterium]|nr:arginase [Nitrosomonadales bacterium]